MPRLPIKIMMNVGNPDRAFDFCPSCREGRCGPGRLEFIINRMIRVHPRRCWSSISQTPELQATTILGMIADCESPGVLHVAK